MIKLNVSLHNSLNEKVLTTNTLGALIIMTMCHAAASCSLYLRTVSTSSVACDLPTACERRCDPPGSLRLPLCCQII